MQGDYYTVKGYCTNCGYKGDIKVRKGFRVPREPQLVLYVGWGGPPVKCENCGNYSCYSTS